MKRIGAVRIPPPDPEYVPGPCGRMQHRGQRVQADVKFAPKACHVGEIDGYNRFRHVEAFEEHGAYGSTVFPTHMLRFFKFRAECVRTDNGSEFASRFTSDKGRPALFERYSARYGMRHKLIRPHAPRHNGKAERPHGKDSEYFYAPHKFYSLKDSAVQSALHNRRYNNFPVRPPGWKSPREVMTSALSSL